MLNRKNSFKKYLLGEDLHIHILICIYKFLNHFGFFLLVSVRFLGFLTWTKEVDNCLTRMEQLWGKTLQRSLFPTGSTDAGESWWGVRYLQNGWGDICHVWPADEVQQSLQPSQSWGQGCPHSSTADHVPSSSFHQDAFCSSGGQSHSEGIQWQICRHCFQVQRYIIALTMNAQIQLPVWQIDML